MAAGSEGVTERKSKPRDPLMAYARNGRGRRTVRAIRKAERIMAKDRPPM